jgi:putative transposase
MRVEPCHPDLTVARQCALLELPRSSYYFAPAGESPENLALMRSIDAQYLTTPFFGSRQMTAWLRRQGHDVNRKRVQRLMRLMALQGAVPGPHTSHPVYPYLLGHMQLGHSNLVWSTDITYVPMPVGFLYLMAIIDWYSRYVLAWALSNTLDTGFCLEALDSALRDQQPCVFNTDQGAQFTSSAFTERLKDHEILISMDGRGRALDNVFIERLWRTLKYEDIYLRDYQSVPELHHGLTAYLHFYNPERPHSALGGQPPAEVHWASLPTLH